MRGGDGAGPEPVLRSIGRPIRSPSRRSNSVRIWKVPVGCVRSSLPALAMGLALALAPGLARALPVLLSDGSAVVTLDPAAEALVSGWTLDGALHLRSQELFVRVEGGAAAPASALEAGAPLASDTDGDGATDALRLALADPEGRFALELRASLVGSPFAPPTAGASSVLGLQIELENTSGGPLGLTLLDRTDVDLFGSPGDDALRFSGTPPSVFRATDASGLVAYESVVTPAPGAVEAGPFDASAGAPEALTGALEAEGDVVASRAFALALPPGGSALLSGEQRLEIAAIPEPGTAGLLLVGLAALGGAGRRSVRRKERA